jgi:hypothetical protein
MLTHKQVKNLNRKLRRWYGDEAPCVIKARTWTDSSIAGIHLLNPDARDFERAFADAERDMFRCIVIHTKRTFGRTNEA